MRKLHAGEEGKNLTSKESGGNNKKEEKKNLSGKKMTRITKAAS